MEQQLLAMLNSASSRPSALPSPGHGLKSPKESTPPQPPLPLDFSPPPGQQSRSIHDLFSNLQSPPVTSPPAQQNSQQFQDLFKNLQPPSVTSPPPQANPGQHQDRLLNMLKGLGQPSDSPGPATPSHVLQNGQAAQNGSREMNDHAKGLLSMFNKPVEPVVQHAAPSVETPAPAPVQTPSPAPIGSRQELPAPSAPAAPTEAPKATSPPTQVTAAPSRSIFDFVSPFDAFDKPVTPAKKAEPKSKAATPVPAAVLAAPSPAPPPAEKLPAQAAPAPAHIKQERADSPASAPDSSKPEKKRRVELDLPYKVGTIVGNASGKGARALSSHTVIDIAQPGLEGLCNEADAVRPIPTTIMRSENVAFTPGRSVASTAIWMGYSMSKGRVRLIDRSYGARLLLQLPPSASTGPQLDLAQTTGYIASLGCDGTVVVWAVPKTWSKDDTPCPVVAAIGPSQTSNTSSIQWVNKEGSPSLLAIGGNNGVVIVDPSKIGGSTEAPISFSQATKGKKVLKAEGSMAAFCLNKAHGALGVISTNNHLTLYSVATEAPVWARSLPTSAPSSPPTSVAFCETQILVGRENNTLLELVQITTEIAVLSSIRFTAPTVSPLHFAQPVYDSERAVLWVANFARTSLYGFHFALRGQPPVTNVSAANIVAFDRMLELPLEPVLSFVVNESKEGAALEDAPLHIYYLTPSGVGDALVERPTLAGLLDGEGVKALPKPVAKKVKVEPEAKEVKESPKVAAKETPKKATPPVSAPKTAEKASPKPEVVAVVESTAIQSSIETGPASVPAPASAVPTLAKATPTSVPAPAFSSTAQPVFAQPVFDGDALSKALKKTEDGLTNKMKQLVTKEVATLASRLEASQQAESSAATERQNALVNKITTEVERSLKGTVAAAVREEIKSVLPMLENVTRQEVKEAVGKSSAAQIAQSMQSLPKEIEKILAPTLARTCTQTLHPIVERSVHDMVSQTLVPSYTQITTQMYDQLSNDIRSEMLGIRKDIVSEQSEALTSTKALVLSMANSIAALSSQVHSLSEQLARSQQPAPFPPRGPMAPSAPIVPIVASAPMPPMPPVAPMPSMASAPVASSAVDLKEAEQTFLAALSSSDQPRAIMDLLRRNFSATDELLPRDRKSPLSQAVLLSLLHRLATVLSEAPPLEEGFNMALAWAHRVVHLIDAKDPETSMYISRVAPVAQGLIRTATLHLGQRGGDQGAGARALGALQQINTILADKLVV